MELKSLHPKAIDASLEKAKHYRLLNDPENAESICLDIIELMPDHQEALVTLILSLTDQFEGSSAHTREALQYLERLSSEYDREYYAGLIYERAAKAQLVRGNPESLFAAYDRFRVAMEHFERAEAMSAEQNDDAILRWNSCARIIAKRNLKPRPEDNYVPYGDA